MDGGGGGCWINWTRVSHENARWMDKCALSVMLPLRAELWIAIGVCV